MTPFDLIIGILIFFAVIVITAVLFGGWLLVSILRFLIGATVSMLGWHNTSSRSRTVRALMNVRCPRQGCRTSNPSTARYCRRCGGEMPGMQRVTVQRAAMW
jgi:hypothetical protein